MSDELDKFHSRKKNEERRSHSKEMFVNCKKTTGKIKRVATLASPKQCSGYKNGTKTLQRIKLKRRDQVEKL